MRRRFELDLCRHDESAEIVAHGPFKLAVHGRPQALETNGYSEQEYIDSRDSNSRYRHRARKIKDEKPAIPQISPRFHLWVPSPLAFK